VSGVVQREVVLDPRGQLDETAICLEKAGEVRVRGKRKIGVGLARDRLTVIR